MTANLVQDVSNAIASGELPLSPIVEILWDEGKDLAELTSSELYDWNEVKHTIIRIEDLARESDASAQDLREFEAAVVAAYAAILVSGATTKSSAALNYVARVCRRVFELFQLELGLSEIQQYRLYRNAYDASRGAEEYRDDVVFELRNSAQAD